jgi:hypothetical protein
LSGLGVGRAESDFDQRKDQSCDDQAKGRHDRTELNGHQFEIFPPALAVGPNQ